MEHPEYRQHDDDQFSESDADADTGHMTKEAAPSTTADAHHEKLAAAEREAAVDEHMTVPAVEPGKENSVVS